MKVKMEMEMEMEIEGWDTRMGGGFGGFWNGIGGIRGMGRDGEGFGVLIAICWLQIVCFKGCVLE